MKKQQRKWRQWFTSSCATVAVLLLTTTVVWVTAGEGGCGVGTATTGEDWT